MKACQTSTDDASGEGLAVLGAEGGLYSRFKMRATSKPLHSRYKRGSV